MIDITERLQFLAEAEQEVRDAITEIRTLRQQLAECQDDRDRWMINREQAGMMLAECQEHNQICVDVLERIIAEANLTDCVMDEVKSLREQLTAHHRDGLNLTQAEQDVVDSLGL
jgi:hypothetical protein